MKSSFCSVQLYILQGYIFAPERYYKFIDAILIITYNKLPAVQKIYSLKTLIKSKLLNCFVQHYTKTNKSFVKSSQPSNKRIFAFHSHNAIINIDMQIQQILKGLDSSFTTIQYSGLVKQDNNYFSHVFKFQTFPMHR